ncbi:MAG TPA: glycosyltransferase family 4 protein [Elusimicrobiota bacterium]|nr:glycosyltransferase family 4 protein [Elusimicrobiota bacterium]
MRVLHVTESRSWSGGTVQLWHLCQALARHGHAAALFCPPESELLRHAAGSDVAVTVCPMRQDYDVFAARALAEAIRRFRPDIVHAHHPRAHALALLAGFFVDIPRLVVSRRVSFRLKKWNFFSQWKYRTSRIRLFVAVSDDIRRVLVAGGVPEERVEVIQSGVDVARFSPRPPDEKLRTELAFPRGTPIVGNLTHFSWWKGQTFFLEAARLVLSSGVPAHFLLVGKDTDGPAARAKVTELGIEKNVTLAGFRTDMPEVLSLLGVSVVSSLAGEGFSGVLRESMSMGIPVVATDVGGNKELVLNEKTGLLVPPGDARSLADAVRRLLTDKTLADSCARAGQESVRSRFSIGKTLERTEKLYERLLAER